MFSRSENPPLFAPTHNHPRAVAAAALAAAQTYPVPVDVVWGLTPRDDRTLDPSAAQGAGPTST